MQKKKDLLRFGIAVVVEIMFLIACFSYNFRDISYEVLENGSFLALQDVGIVVGQGGVEVPSGCWGDVLESRKISVKPGIYDIFVSYEGGGEDVSIWFWNSSIRSGSVVLKADRQELSFRAWVSTVKEDEVLHLNAGGSAFKLKGVTLRRNGRVYACYCLIIQMFLFTIADVFWLLWSGRMSLPGGSRTLFIAGVIAGIAGMASMPLFVRNMVPGIDIVFHLHRIEGIAQGLKMGQFPVRMQPFWFGGRGYPVSIFYCDIFLYFPAMLRLLGFSLQDAYKCYLVVMNLVTAYITWYCIRKMLNSDIVALVGSALYTLSVYRLINVYVRAALGEATAMVFFPLAVYGFWKIVSCPKDSRQPAFSWFPMAAGYTGLILSHMLSSEMAVILTAFVCVILIKKVLQKNILVALLKAVAATVAATAWFVVPFLDYMQDSYQITANPGFGLEENAAFLGQMFGLNYSGLTNRYSLSLNSGVHNEMSMGVGFVLLLGMAMFVLASFTAENRKSYIWRLGNFCLWMGVLCVWLSSDLFPWGNVLYCTEGIRKLAELLQFSWRFLGTATAFLTVVTCCGIVLLGQGEKKQCCSIGVILLLLNTVTWGNFVETALVDNENTAYYSAANLQSLSWGNGDYLPYGSRFGDYLGDRSVYGEGVEIVEDKALPLEVRVRCGSEQGGNITVPLIYYRHYRALDAESGEELAVDCNPDSFLVRVTVPPSYEGKFTVKFFEPWFWRLAEGISLTSAAGILWIQRRLRKLRNL